jgi:tripartite-type tricarboxylate transporter receptor subunit TctC
MRERTTHSILLKIAAVAFAAFAHAAHAQAQAYPSKPIRMVAAASAGGGIDLIARAIAQHLSESFGEPVLVENRVGASGAIASVAVAKAAPDGHTLMLGSPMSHSINPALTPSLPYDPVKDFTPICLVAIVPQVLAVHPSLPVNTVQEFVRLAKSKPGLTFGSAGNGSLHQLAAVNLASMAGINVTHVPYKGAAPALTDLVGGQVDFMMVELAPATPYMKAGRVKALAIATPQRIPGVELPTFAESGFPGFESAAWYGVFGPAGMRGEVVARLNAEILKGLKTSALRDRLTALGASVVGSTPAEFGEYVRNDFAKWKRVVDAAGIKPD